MEFITGLIENYGYIIVTLSILVESMGVPMPGETALVVAAAFAGSGHLNIALVIVCAATGAIIGDSGGYWIGRKLGRPFVEKHGKWLHLTAERMAKLEDLFVKHGPKTVFFGRFFSLLRTYAALFAGIWRMPYRTFMIYNALGGIVWAIVFGVLGFVFGQNLPLLERIARTIGWALTIPFVLIVSLSLAWHWTVRHQSALIDRWKSFADRSFIGRFRRAHASQITAILRRLTAAQYTVVHIAVGLVFACAGVWIFSGIAHSSESGLIIARWDQLILTTLQSWATPLATTIFKSITVLGSYGVAIAALSAALYFITRKKWLNTVSICIIVVGGQLLVFALKAGYAGFRVIPEELLSVPALARTFPSGHAMQSLIVYGLIAYLIILGMKRWWAASGIILLTISLVLVISFSRLYLGTNYFSDVASGLAGGVVWLSSCITALELLRRGQVGDRRRAKRAKPKTQSISLTKPS